MGKFKEREEVVVTDAQADRTWNKGGNESKIIGEKAEGSWGEWGRLRGGCADTDIK